MRETEKEYLDGRIVEVPLDLLNDCWGAFRMLQQWLWKRKGVGRRTPLLLDIDAMHARLSHYGASPKSAAAESWELRREEEPAAAKPEKPAEFPDHGRIREYHHLCPTHGLVFRQMVCVVNNRLWPGLLDGIPPDPLRRCPHDSCVLRPKVFLYSDLDYQTYKVLHPSL